ncbi:exonuclease domain-containing protein, partial [Elusimicrobiota bacterium]
IFQLAFLIEIDGKIVQEKEIRMRPERPDRISPEALEITRKTKAELLSYPPKRQGYEELIRTMERWVHRYNKSDKMLWIGQNPEFDVRFVRTLFREMDDKFFGSWWDRGPADLITLAKIMKIRGHISPPDYKLGSLAAECDVPLEAHDALADVRATYLVWNKLMKLIPPRSAPVKKRKKKAAASDSLELGLS